ncbi:X-ray repair cross-complementing protein 5-like [Ostrinia furnacalis]|uniref:X-ray repair cross-complementing protein 5-like n=1 Tax=Ostrinia furnacalis TaxID=93504 RepID=UPI00103C5FB4|nr:X-ray repair cross-complementing protein 5-like [Ostrinia furnacalis]XP_028179483.1 X-ray repair cross-complementing protein 5-like [Ostrinia furnacalis]
MPPKVDQAAIVILDIGRNVSTADEKGKKSFFEQARECVSRVIERKIMSQGKSLIGVMLLGSKKTQNNMAEQCDGAFRHIEFLAELQSPTWKLIRDLPEQPSKSRGDWMDALIVAADHFKNGLGSVKADSKKIILMTNFMSPTCLDENDIEKVLTGFKEEEFELDVIGLDIFEEHLKSEDIQLARKFVEATNGASASFEYAMQYLLYHKKRAVNVRPWNVDLSIGPNIKIPVSTYIRLKDEPPVKTWLKAVKDPVTLTASSREGIMSSRVHINTDNQEVVEADSVIKGYHYGQQIIPFAECDKSLLYESGEKSLNLYGFTNADNINWQSLTGDGLQYIFGRKGDKKAKLAVRCLTECLHELSLVGIVRRVYNRGNAPKMFAIMPVIDTNDYICLSMIPICYKEDIKYMTFPSTNLKRYECSKEQVDAFKDLIKAMDLMKAYDDSYEDTEAFPIAETVSPSVQYILDCIAFRAMNPGKPLPEPRDEIMMLFKRPPMVEKRSKEPLEKIKNLFTLTKVEVKTRDRKKPDQQVGAYVDNQTADIKPDNQINDVDMPSIKLPVTKKDNTVTKVGTVDPVNDFKVLIENRKPLVDISISMTEAIKNLVYCNFDGIYTKALSAMKAFREECVKSDPTPYNNWIKKFKLELGDRNKDELINLITENQLNFILKEENNSSTYENADGDESQLYETDTVPDATELTMNTEMNDFFNDM